MMKPPKSARKPHKSLRPSSPMGKEHLSKKIRSSRSPMRMSRSTRPPSVKHISPGMKRGHPVPKRKSSHSPRLRSIASSPHRSISRRSSQGSPVSIDRIRSIKRHKYEKRKNSSASPVSHQIIGSLHGGTSSLEDHGISPYHAERYPGSRPPIHPPHYESSSKKKPHREPERFNSSLSPSPPRRPDTSHHPEGHLSRRNESISHSSPPVMHQSHHRSHIAPPPPHIERADHPYEMHDRSRPGPSGVPSSRGKESSLKTYTSEPIGRYRSPSPGDRYPPSSDKAYAPTLHERFSSVVETSRNEPRIRYSREDLEKITIDIRRPLRDHSPTLRHIVNPSDVKLVRRANEGHRPIFDREEIKQAPRDLREDAYYERKTMSGSSMYNSMHVLDLREVENYEITRHRFDAHHALFNSTSGRTLSDRWQNPELRKNSSGLDRDEREYERAQVTQNFVDVRSRSRSGDRDFRSERYAGEEPPPRSRSDYPDRSHRVLGSPQVSRDPVPVRRKEPVHPDARRKLTESRVMDRETSSAAHSDSRGHFHPPSDRHYSESMSIARVERHHSEHRSIGAESHKWNRRSRSHSREEKLPDFSKRPDKYNYKPWVDKPDVTPRGPSYFEHDNREGSESYRGRMNSRPFRVSRGFRSRGFRGLTRGSIRYRGSFRGYRSSSSPRGRLVPRRGRFSPGLWEHDMYSRSSQDRKTVISLS